MFWLIHRFLSHIREQYHKQGAPYELSFEQKQELGLIEPSSWNLEKLSDIQNKIAEPLVLYWFVFFFAFFSEIIYHFTKSNIIGKTKHRNNKKVKCKHLHAKGKENTFLNIFFSFLTQDKKINSWLNIFFFNKILQGPTIFVETSPVQETRRELPLPESEAGEGSG